jgi:hypothetical protein
MMVPFDIMGALGYRYALQIDDDLLIKSPIKVSERVHCA